jgi:hypothetical protein
MARLPMCNFVSLVTTLNIVLYDSNTSTYMIGENNTNSMLKNTLVLYDI